MIKVDLQAIGFRIRQQRIEMGLTQQDIYDKLDISQNHYSRIENGHTGMSFEILLQLSEMLTISTDYILTGKIDNSSHTTFIDKYNKLTNKQKEYINKHLTVFSEYDFQ